MQTVLVSIIIAVALAYIGFLVFKKLRGFTANGSCETGCGKCGTNTTAKLKI
jgi:FeoB-associated Cys-rich membrane protein